MATTKKHPKTYNGFAIPLQPDTELGLAVLIAEDEEGHYEPVAVSIAEAREIAENDLRNRMCRLEREEDPGLCPYTYKLWARGVEGSYLLAADLEDIVK